MAGMVGYKQSKVYFNSKPEITAQINSLSTLVKSRYNPNNKNADTISEMLNRPTTYCFSVIAKNPNTSALFTHNFYFEDKNTAISEHNKLLKRFYNQQTKKYLDKIDKGLKLTIKEQTLLTEEINRLLALKHKDF